jgi:hypothetical protein
MGFASVEEMDAALKAHKDAQEKAKTELQRETEARQKAEAERDSAREGSKAILIRAALLVEAGKAGAVDPDDVVALATREGITVGDDGKVIGADQVVAALAKAKPHLFKAAGGGANGANFRGDKGDDDPADRQEARRRAEQARNRDAHYRSTPAPTLSAPTGSNDSLRHLAW